jgi:hypothetical protein
MDASQIDHLLSEMTFCMFHRPLHPELFKIYNSRQFFQGDYEVSIWITGCSHVVSVFFGRHCMTELICPPDQMLPTQGFVEQFPFRGEKSHSCKWSDGFNYMMNFQVETMSGNLYQHTHGELTKMRKKQGMFVSYPQWAKSELEPFSYIDYEAQKYELHLQTWHAFPDKLTVLKTQSLFNFRR